MINTNGDTRYNNLCRVITKDNAGINTFLGDPDDILECNCQFRCVLQLHVNEMSLLFAPETSVVDPTLYKEDFKDMTGFVRLKTRSDSTSSDKFRK